MILKHLKQKLFSIVTFFFILMGVDIPLTDAAGVVINIVAANGSSSEAQETPIKYYLPKELTADDIINTGGLQLEYDVDKSAYYLTGSIELGPKETRTIKVEVRDVWQVNQEEVEILKEQIEQNLKILEGTPYYETATILRDKMVTKLDNILAQQVLYSDNIERRIEEYRADVVELEKIRKNAFSSDYLKSLPLAEQEARTVKFIIEVKNPSPDQEKTFKQKHYLPYEVRSENVIDTQGFDVRFDEEKQQCYLEKTETFQPGEIKRYNIIIKDIWAISTDSVDALKERAEKALDGIKGSGYESSGTYIFNVAMENLEKITASQLDRQDMRKYIGAFRVNRERFRKSEEEIIKLEQMLAAVRAKKLEEMEKSKVKNILQKLKALRGITAISEAIFGKKPSINTTWKVIWGIMIFVAVFTTIHFFTWWRKSQILGEDMAIKAGGIKEVVTTKEESEEKT